jgi:hypothetical protein
MEKTMRFLKAVAVLGLLATGALALPGVASASPLVAGAAPAARTAPGLVAPTQYYRARPVYRPMRPIARPYPVVRRYPVYRPRPVVRYSRVYRPVLAVPQRFLVCRTRIRLVRTAYGGFVRRPEQHCFRRY